MESMVFRKFAMNVRLFINHPSRVLVVCLVFLFSSFLFNGVLWKLWGLHRDHDRLIEENQVLSMEIKDLGRQLALAKDPSYIEKQARDKLDLVGENDLIFVFSDSPN